MPVMHDRYCVATWEVDQALNKYVLMRSYKSKKNYLKNPAKPTSSCTLKCFGDWDGYGNFHRYEHAFLFETRESKVFLCAAPSAEEKVKWIQFMTNSGPKQDEPPAAPASSGNSISRSSVELKQLMRPSLTLNKGLSSRFIKEVAATNPPGNDGAADEDAQSTTDSECCPDDEPSPSSSDCESPVQGLDRSVSDISEAADQAVANDETQGEEEALSVPKEDARDTPVLVVDVCEGVCDQAGEGETRDADVRVVDGKHPVGEEVGDQRAPDIQEKDPRTEPLEAEASSGANLVEGSPTLQIQSAPATTVQASFPVLEAAITEEKPTSVLKEKVIAALKQIEAAPVVAPLPVSEPPSPASAPTLGSAVDDEAKSPEPLISVGIVPVATVEETIGAAASPQRRVRAYSSMVPNSVETFPTRRYSFGGGLSPMSPQLGFTLSSPIKPTFHNHHLGYVSGLSPTRLSFPDIVTALSRQQSLESQNSDEQAASISDDLAFARFSSSVPEVADIDEV